MRRHTVFAGIAALVFLSVTAIPQTAVADFFGGDLPLLAEIVANTLQQISELKQVIGTGKNTLQFFQEINAGLQDSLRIAQTMNMTLQPGVLGRYSTPAQLLGVVTQLYGSVPQTVLAPEEELEDQSVAEALTLHNQAFSYADQVDPTAEAIKDYSHQASPGGAAKLTAESVGVLITVANQILRTNAAILKIDSEILAVQNERSKRSSDQFLHQYDELGSSIDALEPMSQAADLTTAAGW